MTDIVRSPEFEQGIVADPQNEGLRLRYAKWLREKGQEDWAKFIELQLEVERRSVEEVVREDRESPYAENVQIDEHSIGTRLYRLAEGEEVQAVLDDTKTELLALGIDRPYTIEFQGGMPGGNASFFAATLVEHGEQIFKLLPLTHLSIEEMTTQRAHFICQLEGFTNVQSLTCSMEMDDAMLTEMATCTGGSRQYALRQMDLCGTVITADGVSQLDKGCFQGLQDLTVSETRIGDEGAIALSKLSNIANFQLIKLADSDVTDRGARALLGAVTKGGSNLVEIDLFANSGITDNCRKELREALGNVVWFGSDDEE